MAMTTDGDDDGADGGGTPIHVLLQQGWDILSVMTSITNLET
eukprot:gene3676-1265_t